MSSRFWLRRTFRLLNKQETISPLEPEGMTAYDAAVFGAFFTFGLQFGWHIGGLARVEGPSMLPLLEEGDKLLTMKWKLLYNYHKYFGHRFGEKKVISVPAEDGSGSARRMVRLGPLTPIEWLQNRVITCHVKSDMTVCKRVLAGEKMLDEDRATRGANVWIEGDNKAQSMDSRDYGSVPVSAIDGAVLAIVWPPNRWRWLFGKEDEHYAPQQPQPNPKPEDHATQKNVGKDFSIDVTASITEDDDKKPFIELSGGRFGVETVIPVRKEQNDQENMPFLQGASSGNQERVSPIQGATSQNNTENIEVK